MHNKTKDLLDKDSASKYILVTDTREVKALLNTLDARLTESDYTAIIVKAGYDTGVLILDNSVPIIETIAENKHLCGLAQRVEPIVYSIFHVLLLWTMTNNPTSGFTTFNGERLWLWWK